MAKAAYCQTSNPRAASKDETEFGLDQVRKNTTRETKCWEQQFLFNPFQLEGMICSKKQKQFGKIVKVS